jgi:anti-sigma B factor antagonist
VDPVLGTLTVLERAPGRWSITGELDLATAPQLDELQGVHGPLLLDLHGVTFLDSSGIRALLQLRQRCPDQDCTFLICACSFPVERVLRIAGLYEIFTREGEARVNGDDQATWLADPEVAAGTDAAAVSGE